MFQKPNPKQSFPTLEHEVIEYWKKTKMFEQSLEKNKGRKEYVFYDGPPFATGLPHYGHILAGTLKDVVPRYQTMKGYFVPRRWGWDCHGLPIENLIEQELKLKSKKEIGEFGVDKFNEACRASVLRYTNEWGKIVERTGRWVDFEDSYKTMDTSYMESIWWVFKRLWDKKLIYRGKKAMHICPRCETPLSNFEVGQEYKDITDLSVIWKFRLAAEQKTFLLAWTTTPWSTLSTMGLSINPKFTYIKVKINDEYVIFAKERLGFVMKGISNYEIIEEFSGKKLVGKRYEHIAPWYQEFAEVKNNPRVFHVYAGDYVEITEGTGVVTINGSYGEIDLEAVKKNKLPVVMDVGMDGKFTRHAGSFSGMNVKKAEPKLVEYFGKKGLVFRHEAYAHSYPHCWRCDTPLLNYCTESWFVAVEKIKKKMLSANEKIHWIPEHIKHGRFGKWLQNARDWAISRSRYWGTPLPVWIGDKGTVECLGSLADLRAHIPKRFTKITFVRHGQSEGNTVHLRQSIAPGTGLTKEGLRQSEEAAKKLAKIHEEEPFDLVISSPLLRCKQTAEILTKKLKLSVQEDALLQEIHFGNSEGKRDHEMKDDIVRRKNLDPEERYQEKIGKTGESHADVEKRALEFIQQMMKEHPGKSVLVVTHSDVIRFALRHVFGKTVKSVYDQGHFPACVPKEIYFDNETGKLADLHKHFVDEMTYHHPRTGELMRRIPEVLDCWFESGAMPYAQTHYPFENKERFEATFPANFIAEGLDQTRGWFYTLIVLSAALFDEPAFQNIIVNGIVLAEDGQKMSKRKKNYPDPSHIFETYGVDAMRLYLMNSPVVKADDLRFSEKGVQEAIRSTILPLWNGYSFFLTYALIDGWKPKNNLYFVRHGETEQNKNGGVQGNLDQPLNDKGRDQIEVLRGTVKGLPIDAIVSSDYLRAKETAQILNADFGLEIEYLEGLREQSYGEYEGITFEEMRKKYPKSKNIHYDLRKNPKNGETIVQFEKRVLQAVTDTEHKYHGKNVLLVAHAGVHHVLQKRKAGVKTWKTYYTSHYQMVQNGQLTVFTQPADFQNPLDRWIISELHILTRNMTAGLDKYDLMNGLAPLVRFIDGLTNWYIRRSRRRFWKSENDADKSEAYKTLYTVLIETCKLLAPFAPFITEAIFRNMTGLPSVHLAEWPEYEQKFIDQDLHQKTELVRKVVMLGHGARAKAQVKVRQPLSSIEVVTNKMGKDQMEVIRDELNVKDVKFSKTSHGKVRMIVKPNARILGPKFGAKVQDIIREAKAGRFKELPNGHVEVLGHELSKDEIEIGYHAVETEKGSKIVEADGGIVVILNTDITPELKREGYARDLVRTIQGLRKRADLHVADRIKVGLSAADPEIQKAIDEFEDYIKRETLAVSINSEKLGSSFEEVLDFDGHGVVVTILLLRGA